MHCVIIAGGSGTRFWPRSRRRRPKQLLKLLGNHSPVELTVKRLQNYNRSEGIYVVASAELAKQIQAEIPQISDENLIIEPSGRNTAPAIALAAFTIRQRFGDAAVMGVFPADHLIEKERKFHHALRLAERKAREGPNLVTLGIQPTYPATGYGYVEFKKDGDGDVHPVIRFTEKPDLTKARTFLEGGRHLWNGGMFIWQAGTILDNMAHYLPNTFKHLAEIQTSFGTPELAQSLERIWPEVDAISVDYGILEHARHIYSVEAQFKWYDLGNWRTLYQLLPKDRTGSSSRGDVALFDTRGSLVISEDHFTAVIGGRDLVVISTEDATLVLPREQAERVGEVIDWLKARDREELL